MYWRSPQCIGAVPWRCGAGRCEGEASADKDNNRSQQETRLASID